MNHLIREAIQIQNSRYAFISPTYKQGKNIAWDILKEYARKVDGVQFNEAELRADFANGSRITLYGSDNPDALRGMGLWGVVFDEYSQQPSNIFTEIIRPALADHNGFAVWIGTPKGKNDFYRLYEQARKDRDWLDMLLTVKDTSIISDKELADAKKVMSDEEFEQEFNCSFESAIRGAYYSKQLQEARTQGRITKVPYDEMAEVHTWWDLGVSDSTSIGFFQKIGGEWHLIDYYEASGEGLGYYVQVLEEKKQTLKYKYGTHYAPHDIAQRELTSGKSRQEIAKSLGIEFEIAPKLEVQDGINAVRMRFNTLWIDADRCERLLDALTLYRKEWNEKMGDFKPKPLHDWSSHAADMLRYWAVTKYEKEEPLTPFRPQSPYGGRLR